MNAEPTDPLMAWATVAGTSARNLPLEHQSKTLAGSCTEEEVAKALTTAIYHTENTALIDCDKSDNPGKKFICVRVDRRANGEQVVTHLYDALYCRRGDGVATRVTKEHILATLEEPRDANDAAGYAQFTTVEISRIHLGRHEGKLTEQGKICEGLSFFGKRTDLWFEAYVTTIPDGDIATLASLPDSLRLQAEEAVGTNDCLFLHNPNGPQPTVKHNPLTSFWDRSANVYYYRPTGVGDFSKWTIAFNWDDLTCLPVPDFENQCTGLPPLPDPAGAAPQHTPLLGHGVPGGGVYLQARNNFATVQHNSHCGDKRKTVRAGLSDATRHGKKGGKRITLAEPTEPEPEALELPQPGLIVWKLHQHGKKATVFNIGPRNLDGQFVIKTQSADGKYKHEASYCESIRPDSVRYANGQLEIYKILKALVGGLVKCSEDLISLTVKNSDLCIHKVDHGEDEDCTAKILDEFNDGTEGARKQHENISAILNYLPILVHEELAEFRDTYNLFEPKRLPRAAGKGERKARAKANLSIAEAQELAKRTAAARRDFPDA